MLLRASFRRALSRGTVLQAPKAARVMTAVATASTSRLRGSMLLSGLAPGAGGGKKAATGWLDRVERGMVMSLESCVGLCNQCMQCKQCNQYKQ